MIKFSESAQVTVTGTAQKFYKESLSLKLWHFVLSCALLYVEKWLRFPILRVPFIRVLFVFLLGVVAAALRGAGLQEEE